MSEIRAVVPDRSDRADAGLSEAEEVGRAIRGDRDAFPRLAEGHWQRLVSLARSVVGDLDAEDAVQEGLLLAWRKLSTLRDPGAFTPWLTRIVVRLCLRRARRRGPFLPLEEAPEPAAPPRGPEDLDVARLLRQLAPRQRAVMHLTVVEGMTDGEIGRSLGIAAGSVRAHRRRARQRLQQLLPEASTASPYPSTTPSGATS